MKGFVQLSTVLLVMVLSSLAASPYPQVKEDALKAENDWKQAVLKGDRNALDKLLLDDLSYTHSSAKTQTKEQFIQDATGGSTVYKSIDFENTKVRQYGSVVVITHSAVITTVQTRTSHLYLTEVWAEEGGRWRMASRQLRECGIELRIPRKELAGFSSLSKLKIDSCHYFSNPHPLIFIEREFIVARTMICIHSGSLP